MLETRFPRFVGDIGNPASFDFPVLYRTVPRARPDRVVCQDPAPLLPAFIEAGRALIDQGARGITTSCGFLTLFQRELSTALDVPVLTSSLYEVARQRRALPAGRTVGILTISAASLSSAHLRAAQVPKDCPIGAPVAGGAFATAILGNRARLDRDLARGENLAAARRLVAAHPTIDALVLECTNMGPYAGAIAAETGVQVHSILTALARFQRTL